MKEKHTIIGLSVVLATFLMTGCSRMSEEEAQARKEFSSIPDDMPVKILGDFDLVSGIAREVNPGPGSSLSITATSMDAETIEMKFDYRSTISRIGGLTKEAYTQKSRFLLRPGMRCAPKMGDDLAVVIRPKVKDSIPRR